MDNDRWNHVDQLLQSALDIPAVERDAYLRNACGGDQRLEDEVRSLLAAHDRADRFLGAPAIDLAARELAGERSDDGSQVGARSADRSDALALPHRREARRRRDGRGVQSRRFAAPPSRCAQVRLRRARQRSRRPWAGSRARRRRRRRSTTRTSAPSTTSASRTGASFIVMEYLEGTTLKDRLAAGALSLNTAPRRGALKLPTRWTPRTARASSTATSNPPTSSSPRAIA